MYVSLPLRTVRELSGWLAVGAISRYINMHNMLQYGFDACFPPTTVRTVHGLSGWRAVGARKGILTSSSQGSTRTSPSASSTTRVSCRR